MAPFLQNVNCSILSANIRPDRSFAHKVEGYYFPYKIFHIGTEKVAVVGYTSRETPALSMPGKVKSKENTASNATDNVPTGTSNQPGFHTAC